MSNEPFSSPCYAADAEDSYMGYASRDELLVTLNELLEAERAGARVALASRTDAEGTGLSSLMDAVHTDEARWCAMLAGQIRRLKSTPSVKTGDFYSKAMKISCLDERVAFLNRGQAWVVRKLEELLPRVRDEILHADLHEMAERHRANILLAEQCRRESQAAHRGG